MIRHVISDASLAALASRRAYRCGVREQSWRPLVGTVVWHAGHRGSERPVAVVVEGERLSVEVEDAWTMGPAVAGGALVPVFVVRDELGRRLRLSHESAGGTQIEIAAER
jgi:hypothetical protein